MIPNKKKTARLESKIKVDKLEKLHRSEEIAQLKSKLKQKQKQNLKVIKNQWNKVKS